MKPTVADICAFMETWAPAQWAYPWDRVGLQLGRPDQAVSGIIVCLTITQQVFEAAQRNRANLIVAHHPLIWDPIKNLRTDQPHTQLCLELLQQGIACFVAHTNLDMAPEGVNDALAKKLNLINTTPLFIEPHAQCIKLATFVPESHRMAVVQALAAAGAGTIGAYSHCSFAAPGTGTFLPQQNAQPFCGKRGMLNQEPECRLEMLLDKARLEPALAALRAIHPYEEPALDIIPLENPANIGLGRIGELPAPIALDNFAQHVRKSLRLPYVQLFPAGKKKVQTVAVLGGSGGSSCARLPHHIDVFVSGDIGYHDAQSALLKGIACIDASHGGSESPIVNTIARKLRRAFPKINATPCQEKCPIKLIAPPLSAVPPQRRN